jgi:CheY-like chemotaxis protein
MEGHEVREARNGRDAIVALQQAPSDLVLLDLNMPIMDGWTFCEEQRRRPGLANVPIALMSARHNLTAREAPCAPAAVIEKPFDVSLLLARVGDVISA